MKKIDKKLKEKLKKTKLLILDVDGVLTDNTFSLTGDGKESKNFNISDGMGIYLAKKSNIEVALISGRESEATKLRAQDLSLKYVYLGRNDKINAYENLKSKLNLKDWQIAYVGDDVLDIPILKKVGVPICVKNAYPAVKRYATYVTEKEGGKGAVREVIDLILETKKIKPWELVYDIGKG